MTILAALLFLAPGEPASAQKLVRTAGRNYVVVGDMLFNPEQARSLMIGEDSRTLEDGSQAPRATGFSYYNSTPWPGGVLPIVFPSNVTSTQRSMIMKACALWSERAPVRCVRRSDQRARYVIVKGSDAQACYSTVGMSDYYGEMTMGPNCWTQSVIAHELGHAFGLIHEHQRPDRDRYIIVLWDNIQEDFKYAYAKINANTHDLGYNYRSIMHYHAKAFSKNGRVTFHIRPEYRDRISRDQVGIAQKPSRGDGRSLAKVYGQGSASAAP